MRGKESHLADQEILLAADGELSAGDKARVDSHLAACWKCRTRKQELETAVGDFIRDYRGALDARVPAADGPRALLRARMAQSRQSLQRPRLALQDLFRKLSWPIAATLLLGALVGYFGSPSWITPQRVRAAMVTVPNHALTPGATIFIGREEVCRASISRNKEVPAAVRRKVFEEYGISFAEPRAYEVDYLITPALGGSDDIHNLWPQSNSATIWNSRVKDALEDHLRNLVCSGQLDLATAQREIATDWIAAYKKYFHTDRPLEAAKPR